MNLNKPIFSEENLNFTFAMAMIGLTVTLGFVAGCIFYMVII